MHLSGKDLVDVADSVEGINYADFVPKEFSNLIKSQGYNVVYEEALSCPCKSDDSGFLNTCRNCGGSGYVFVNPQPVKMILTGVSSSHAYDETARIGIGQMYATPVMPLRLCPMDRITTMDGKSEHKEVVFPSKDVTTGNFFALLHYPVATGLYVGLFDGADRCLRRLHEGVDYIFENKTLHFTSRHSALERPSVTVRYAHWPQYHVWDILNDIRSVKTQGLNGARQNNFMPVRAVVKRTHLILDKENFYGNKVVDNSWKNTGVCAPNGCGRTTAQERAIRYAGPEKIWNVLTASQRLAIKGISDRLLGPSSLTLTAPLPMVTIG